MNVEIQTSAGATGFDFFSRPLCDPENFPMLVWLRGDESYCEDFSLGADAVMEILGIKRSRLTQISGRELRVARRRDGRYVKPMYRPIDVEDYKDHARAPMSHLKSSEVFHQTFEGIWEQLDSKLTQEIESLKELQLHVLGQLKSTFKKQLDQNLAQNLLQMTQFMNVQFTTLESIQKISQQSLQNWVALQLSELASSLIPVASPIAPNELSIPAKKSISRTSAKKHHLHSNYGQHSAHSFVNRSPSRKVYKDLHD